MSQTKVVERSLPSAMGPTGDGSPTERLSVSRVKAEELLFVWSALVPQVRRGLKRGMGDTLSERGLFSGVLRGDTDLWVMREGGEVVGGIFLRIDERERGPALVVLNVVGRDFGRYVGEMLQRFREYADMIGAYTIESYSRLGAARKLMRLGCKPKAMVMELRDGRRS